MYRTLKHMITGASLLALLTLGSNQLFAGHGGGHGGHGGGFHGGGIGVGIGDGRVGVYGGGGGHWRGGDRWDGNRDWNRGYSNNYYYGSPSVGFGIGADPYYNNSYYNSYYDPYNSYYDPYGVEVYGY